MTEIPNSKQVEEEKRPSRFKAIVATVAAACSLTASLLLLALGTAHGALLALQLVASMLLAVAAIAAWVVYFRQWVDFEIRRLEPSATTNQ